MRKHRNRLVSNLNKTKPSRRKKPKNRTKNSQGPRHHATTPLFKSKPYLQRHHVIYSLLFLSFKKSHGPICLECRWKCAREANSLQRFTSQLMWKFLFFSCFFVVAQSKPGEAHRRFEFCFIQFVRLKIHSDMNLMFNAVVCLCN